MIHVTVGMRYLRRGLGGRGTEIDKALARLTSSLDGKRFESVDAAQKLSGISVFDVLKRFHSDLSKLLEEEARPLQELIDFELRYTSEAVYRQSNFQISKENARDLLALYGPLPHGTTSRGSLVFLPDMSPGVKLFGSLITKVKVTPHVEPGTVAPAAILTFSSTGTPVLECHLCDDLCDVYRRAADGRAAQIDAEESHHALVAEANRRRHQRNEPVSPRALAKTTETLAEQDDTLLLDAESHGFWGYRSLQRSFPGVPTIADPRLLAASALRSGLAKPVISATFPHQLWRQFESPVKHFLLDSAEVAGGDICAPMYPNTPDAKEMKEVCVALANEDMPKPSDRHAHLSSLARPEIDAALKQLGVREAIEAVISSFEHREAKGEWVWDYRLCAVELYNSLVGMDIERSISLENTLNLYPLHKRVLGLLEAMIGPKLQSVGWDPSQPRAAGILQRWATAFFHPIGSGTFDLKGHPKHRHRSGACEVDALDYQRPFEVGVSRGWINHATMKSGTSRGIPYCRAADLVEDLVNGIFTIVGSAPGSISLQNINPEKHAQQLRLTASATDQGRRLLLHLGTLMICLRNFIEHGLDQPSGDGLVITNDEYWATRYSQAMGTPSTTAYPRALGSLYIDANSLSSCLAIISLVLYGTQDQLNIQYR